MKRAIVVSCSLALALLALVIGFTPSGSAFEAQQGVPIITTVAGGGSSSSVPVQQAPMTRPSVVALDTSLQNGFGLYVVDEIQGRTVVRYANGSNAAVIRAGVNIGVGEIAVVAGGGDIFENIDGLPARVVDLQRVTGLVVDPSGNAIYLNAPDYRAILLINVSTNPFTTGGKTVQPGRVGGFIDTQFLNSVGLARRPNGDIYVVGNPFGQPSQAVIARLRPNDTPLVVAGGGTNLPPGDTGNGGQATSAILLTPIGVEFDNDGNLIIAEAGSGRTLGSIRKVTDGIINALIENLDYPVGLTRAPDGSFYVPLGNAQQIGRFTSNSNNLDIVAGDNSKAACTPNTNPTCGDGGPATSAKFNIPGSETQRNIQLAADAQGIFIPDASPFVPTMYAHVRYVNRSGSAVTRLGTTIAANGINSIVGTTKVFPYDETPAIYAELSGPRSVGADAQGNIYIADTLNDRIRFVNRGTAPVTIFAGTSSAQTVQPGQIVTVNNRLADPATDDRVATALFSSIEGLHVVANGIYVADALSGVIFPPGAQNPNSGTIKFINTSNSPVTFYPGAGANAITVNPGDVKVIAGLRGVPPNQVPPTIGDGSFALQAIIFPADVTLDAAGNIYIADYEATRTNRVRRIAASNGAVSTLYGDGGQTLISRPTAIATDTQNRIVVADTFNNRILRQNTPGGSEFSTIADGSQGLNRPRGVSVAADGSIIVVSSQNYRLYKVVAPNNSLGTTTVLAGTGILGFSGDGGPADQAQLALAQQTATPVNQETVGVTVAPNGAVLFADTNNGRIRQVFDEPPALLTSVSAATFLPMLPLASESIVAGFGPNVASDVALAQGFPLPFTLLGTSVEVKDSANTIRAAPLFAVTPIQVNYQIPPGTVLGPATVTVRSGLGKVLVGNINIEMVQPGLFSANAVGNGVAAGQFQRYNPGLVGIQDTFQCNAQGCTPLPVAFGPPAEALFLIIYGTGFRFNGSLAGVTASIGGTPVPVAFAGPQGVFVGEDQANLGPLPRTLIGKGTADVVFTVNGKVANTVTVAFQ